MKQIKVVASISVVLFLEDNENEKDAEREFREMVNDGFERAMVHHEELEVRNVVPLDITHEH